MGGKGLGKKTEESFYVCVSRGLERPFSDDEKIHHYSYPSFYGPSVHGQSPKTSKRTEVSAQGIIIANEGRGLCAGGEISVAYF
jgi:hypothetical protein